MLGQEGSLGLPRPRREQTRPGNLPSTLHTRNVSINLAGYDKTAWVNLSKAEGIRNLPTM